jgi:hypothetical protein
MDEQVLKLSEGATWADLSADAWWLLIDAAPKKLARAWHVEQEGTWLQAVRLDRWGETCDWHGRRDCVAHWEVRGLSYLKRWNGCAASLAEAKAAADAALLADGWLLGGGPVEP